MKSIVPLVGWFSLIVCTMSAQTTRSATTADDIGAMLRSKDPAVQQQAMAAIREEVKKDANMGAAGLRNQWRVPIDAPELQAELAEICREGAISGVNYQAAAETFLRARVQALLAAGKVDDAIAAAKSYYNFSSMATTSDAILMLHQALRAKDQKLARRFKLEQLAAATTQPVEGSGVRVQGSGEEPEATPAGAVSGEETVLASIKVDPKPYEEAIKALEVQGDFGSLVQRGNLLLIADRPAEAKEVFEEAYEVAGDSDVANASECLARAMKAQDGGIGRANGFVLSIRPKE